MKLRSVTPEALMDPADRTYRIICDKVVEENLTKAQMLEVYDQLRIELMASGTLDHKEETNGQCDCQERFDAIRDRLIDFYDRTLSTSTIDELYKKTYDK